jgi:acetyl-CoA carboxylase biotin carboxyl carrier protein
LNTERITALIDLVADIGIHELEIEDAGDTIRITLAKDISDAAKQTSSPQLQPLTTVTAPAPSVDKTSSPVVSASSKTTTFKAPMAGIFYRAASADAKPFVDVGMTVDAGASLCIIEAMKIMTEIEAEASGTIARIYCENGEFIERGQALFDIH